MRFLQYFPTLKESGVEICWSPLLRDDYLMRLYAGKSKNFLQIILYYIARFFVLLGAKKFDFVWIEKELFPGCPAWAERCLSLFGVNYIVDYDDAVFHNYGLGANFWRRLLRKKIAIVMRCAAIVVCGNDYIKRYAVAAGARRIEIIPTVIDLTRYSVRSSYSNPPTTEREPIIIGWIGSPSTTSYLNIITPALCELSKRYAIRLCLMGAKISEIKFSGNELFQVDYRAWSEVDEVSCIKEFDVGVMPLTDTPWAHGKCGYKLIQYMACGVPCIASPIGANKEIIIDNLNGYWADNLQQWVESFSSLIDDTEKKHAFGMAGRQHVEANYSLQVTAPYLISLFKLLVKKSL